MYPPMTLEDLLCSTCNFVRRLCLRSSTIWTSHWDGCGSSPRLGLRSRFSEGFKLMKAHTPSVASPSFHKYVRSNIHYFPCLFADWRSITVSISIISGLIFSFCHMVSLRKVLISLYVSFGLKPLLERLVSRIRIFSSIQRLNLCYLTYSNMVDILRATTASID